MAVNAFKAPKVVQWGNDSQGRNKRPDLPNFGFTGDSWLGPLFVDPEWADYEQSVLFVDPSGRGKDETAWAIVKVLNGMMYVTEVSGFAGDPAEAMVRIATSAKNHNVSTIQVEPNFAGGVWIAAFQPILAKVWPAPKAGDTAGCSVEEAAWSRNQKEVRIIDTLEPVMSLHRLVVDERVAEDAVLMYQLTHISREKGCLSHDDRVDALAGAVSYLQHVLMQDVNEAVDAMREAEEDAELERFMRAHERMNSGDTRVFQYGSGADDEDDYEVFRVTIH